MSDWSLVRVKRQSPIKTLAVNGLKDALRIMSHRASDGDIDPSTRFQKVAELYLEELKEESELGSVSPSTVRVYRNVLKNWAYPKLGKLHCYDVIVTRCSNAVREARRKASYDTAKTLKSALSGVCDFAVRRGALEHNPMRDIGRMSRTKPKKKVVALDAAQRVDLHEKLVAYGQTRQVDACGRSLGRRGQLWRDLPDLMEVMLATGVRIGECLALLGPDIDLDNKTVAVTHHIIRVDEVGLVRRPLRKGNEDELLLKIPEWSIPVFRRRKATAGDGPLFASFAGGLLDPSNVINRVSEAMVAVGYDWVTSHVFRKTVGMVLDEADRPLTAIADQLGNSPEVANKHYRKVRTANAGNVEALEAMLPPGEE
ncbi:tyrosine-type recombinase/integrase [Amycolatopsis carbonis]|uniref:Tyrosine-type recombinase/integrase n=1 Tax=Amycolatopsis carbonis TaxID=715471 RepID=A0A9Y2IQC0_9PSEU|nr:tyrosine-type recombinase/integrase [Amycolatopsis sp. 2-15]WIX83476.1 tyrosine-type recombinase/integrase [Amycolatopsis sp. 2-15]